MNERISMRVYALREDASVHAEQQDIHRTRTEHAEREETPRTTLQRATTKTRKKKAKQSKAEQANYQQTVQPPHPQEKAPTRRFVHVFFLLVVITVRS